MLKKLGGGVAFCGRFIIPTVDSRDALVRQISAGNGVGCYGNDLSSIGNYDGVFNLSNGELTLFDVVAAYTSLQHRWGVRGNYAPTSHLASLMS